MFKGLANVASLMKQAQEMQGRMAELQEQLAQLRVDGESGGGMVAVVVNGQQQLLSCRIEPTLIESGDQELIEELVVAAVNDALDKVKQETASRMAEVAGGLNLPGLGDALSRFGLGPTG